jgi:peptidyl-Asp metalloendopeptidase
MSTHRTGFNVRPGGMGNVNAATAGALPARIGAWCLGLTAAAVIALSGTPAARAADRVPMLLTAPAASEATRADTSRRVERSVARHRAVTVNLEHLDPENAAPPSEIGVELFDGMFVTLDMVRVERRTSGNYTWIGNVRGYDGSQAVLTVVDGKIAGMVALVDSAARAAASYQLVTEPDGRTSLRQINPEGFPADHPPGGEALHAPDHAKALTLGPDRTDKAAVSSADTGATIDVLVVYSRQTAAAAGTAIGAQVQQAVDTANAAYANSGISTRLRLVYSGPVAYDESGDFGTDLSRLTSATDGYMDEVATLRNTYGADLVSLFIENTSYCGIAWVGPSANYAYSVINRGCASGNLSFAHEIGHNFGALHDPYVDASTTPYAYGHGYALPAAGWRTVMAYNNVCVASGVNCARVPYFSNPNLSYGTPAQAMGTLATNDNTRVHNQNAYTIANFRSVSSTTPTCSYVFSPTSASVPATASSGNFAVSAATGCAWNSTSSATWLKISTGSATSGTGRMYYTVAANTGPARSAALKVGGVAFTVSQASGCSYSLSASSASVGASGGTGSVSLTTGTGCTWTASSSTAWLSLTSAVSGSGSAKVTYSVAANPGSLRTANLAVGGKTYVVTQAAAPVVAPVAQLSAASITFSTTKVGSTSATKNVTLKNAGTGALSIATLTPGGTNPGEFLRSGTCKVGTSLAAGQSCTVVYQFKPAAAGTRSATLSIGTNAGTLGLALKGTAK